MKGVLKEKNIILTCLSRIMVAAMLGNWFLETALSSQCNHSAAYSPIYLNASIISLSKKKKEVFKTVDKIIFHLNQ